MSAITIDTPQNVPLQFDAAGVGARIGARMLDIMIRFIYVVLLGAVLSANPFELLGFSFFYKDPAEVIFIILLLLPFWFYSPLLHTIWSGQTVGKRAMNIRIVRTDGSPGHFRDYMLRWLLLPIDLYLSLGFIGILSMIASSKSQRLGDLAAGTTVIALTTTNRVRKSFMREIKADYEPVFHEVQRLSDRDMNTIDSVLRKHRSRSNKPLMKQLVRRLFTVLNVDTTDPRTKGMSAEKFIQTVIRDYNYYSGKL
ncbi:MAG: RDD family protein [Bacteroidota bacterium]